MVVRRTARSLRSYIGINGIPNCFPGTGKSNDGRTVKSWAAFSCSPLQLTNWRNPISNCWYPSRYGSAWSRPSSAPISRRWVPEDESVNEQFTFVVFASVLLRNQRKNNLWLYIHAYMWLHLLRNIVFVSIAAHLLRCFRMSASNRPTPVRIDHRSLFFARAHYALRSLIKQ